MTEPEKIKELYDKGISYFLEGKKLQALLMLEHMFGMADADTFLGESDQYAIGEYLRKCGVNVKHACAIGISCKAMMESLEERYKEQIA